MSDFIFSSSPTPLGHLTRILTSIYHQGTPEVKEFHGSWGSLGVNTYVYQGFTPLETDEHICLVIGGPVLTFTDNGFHKRCNLTKYPAVFGGFLFNTFLYYNNS